MLAAHLRGLNTLIIDDDVATIQVTAGFLKALGIDRLAAARTGSEAVNKIMVASTPFDLILCDFRMPNGNGLQLLKAIRLGQINGAKPEMSFVLFSAACGEDHLKLAGLLDVDYYIHKPLTTDKLKTAIEKARAKRVQPDTNKYLTVSDADLSTGTED